MNSRPTILHVADSPSMGRGATVRFGDGSPCTLSIARSGVFVKKSRIGVFGAKLYDEKNIYNVAKTAMALAYLYPERLFPDGASDPILRAFLNAILHCESTADVSVALNEAVSIAEKRLGRALLEVDRAQIPDWARGGMSGGADTTPLQRSAGTEQDPIVIEASSSLEGIPKEHAALDERYGERSKNWKLIDRLLLPATDGRRLEKFIISASGRRVEVFFDVTKMMAGNSTAEAKARRDKLEADYDNDLVTINLPKEESFALSTVLLRLSDEQLSTLGVSRERRLKIMNAIMNEQMKFGTYERIPEHIEVTESVSDWIIALNILKQLVPADLLQEEEFENLKAIIHGTLARRKP